MDPSRYSTMKLGEAHDSVEEKLLRDVDSVCNRRCLCGDAYNLLDRIRVRLPVRKSLT